MAGSIASAIGRKVPECIQSGQRHTDEVHEVIACECHCQCECAQQDQHFEDIDLQQI